MILAESITLVTAETVQIIGITMAPCRVPLAQPVDLSGGPSIPNEPQANFWQDSRTRDWSHLDRSDAGPTQQMTWEKSRDHRCQKVPCNLAQSSLASHNSHWPCQWPTCQYRYFPAERGGSVPNPTCSVIQSLALPRSRLSPACCVIEIEPALPSRWRFGLVSGTLAGDTHHFTLAIREAT